MTGMDLAHNYWACSGISAIEHVFVHGWILRRRAEARSAHPQQYPELSSTGIWLEPPFQRVLNLLLEPQLNSHASLPQSIWHTVNGRTAAVRLSNVYL